ncbi:MAG: multidrug effflux MFS transporter [Planktotalea sp.]|jgi:DHA1 family bicyclomycin/chloramphenicol resistance-like MFS transporter|uniref:multidrug effflux MFS transporter n=1 Tax=Planktotalea sp. TaxID=2029877 RepID=UPI000183B18B|nr:multidrug effflux MFS transporter [Planktotalea sp.]EDZ42215.1 drug resistance transporter, Bcr/CflA family [Rhodobacteraceae bacterium HTCC2083]MDG1077509.1 multidrug effflux MFS transporter [Planktotalea sp.]HCW84767.1 Bcr/CflA family drug resistance efflux transporter [Paracoccaceae bacterium]
MRDTYSARFLDRATPPHIITLILLAGVAGLAMNVFLPSLPNMALHFETEYWVLQMSVAAYFAMNAVLQILIGPVSDNLGRRPVVLWGLLLFTVASIGCIYAPNATVFLMFRMCQAIIVTAMVLSRAIIRDVVSADKAASLIGYVTMGMAVVPMLGPMLGGLLDETFGWQASFWLMALSGFGMFVLCYFDQGETKRATGETLRQQFGHYPELFSSPRFWGYSIASGLTSGAFFAYLGGAPYVGTEIFKLSPAILGFYFGAPALGYFIGNFLSGRYSMRIGINSMVLYGTIIATIATVASLLVFSIGQGSPVSFFGFMTIVGIGNGLTIPNATSGMLSVRPHLAGTASGLGGAIMIGFGAILSALAGIILTGSDTALPVLWLMVASTLGGLISAIYVIHRAKAIGA